MASRDRLPLSGTPVTDRIRSTHNNRLGAVYSSLYSFWMSRQAALDPAHSQSSTTTTRRDAYSVILFDHTMNICLENDFTSSPGELLDGVLPYNAAGGTDYTTALSTTEAVMRRHWNTAT